MAFEPSTLEQSIQNGSGTELYFWPPGLSVRRRKFPMLLTNITHNGITTPSLDTTHLGTEPPDDTNEFGGRTSIPGLLSDPGQLTLEGFLNASVILPKRIIVLQIVFPLPPGHSRPARWLGQGFITQRGSISITTDTNMMQTNVLQLTGNIAISQAQRIKAT